MTFQELVDKEKMLKRKTKKYPRTSGSRKKQIKSEYIKDELEPYSPYLYKKTIKAPLELERDIVEADEWAKWESKNPELNKTIDFIGYSAFFIIFLLVSILVISALFTHPILLVLS